MKTLLFLISFWVLASGFEPVRDYARAWELDTATMTDDTLIKQVILFSFPEAVRIAPDGLKVLVEGDILDTYAFAQDLATGSYGNPEMQSYFRERCWENLISAFELVYFYRCAKDDIANRWACIEWVENVAEWLGLPRDDYGRVQEELAMFVAEMSRALIEEQ